MNPTLENRFEGLKEAISILADRAQARRDSDDKKANMVKDLIGKPYYWDLYSGVIHASKKKTEVEVRLVHQVTGKDACWTFDAIYVHDHVKRCGKFSTWEEYNENQKLSFAKDMEEMLIKYEYSEQAIEEKMTEYCLKFEVPYKLYWKK